MSDPAFLPYKPLQVISEEEMKNNSLDFLNKIGFRKSIRHFSEKPVPLSIIKNCIKLQVQRQTVQIFSPGNSLLSQVQK